MTRGRQHDSLEALRRRRASWAREIGRNGMYADIAPRMVAELDEEIARLTPEGSTHDR